MCGRFDDFADPKQLAKYYNANIEQVENWVPHYNVAPDTNVPVLFDDGERDFQFARWGLRPEWYVKKFGTHKQQINSRAETLIEKPFYRKQLQERRCILPVTGYFEWKKTSSGKQPYRFTAKDEGDLLSLACVWEVDKVQGHDQVTFAIVTTEANDMMKPIHNRMPVSLGIGDVDEWLNPETPPDELHEMMRPPETASLRSYMVSRDVNSPRNDNPSVIEPV